MESCLKQMDSKGREVLLQYVFYGFQSQPKSATEFLHWHQAIVKMDGIGAIVRVATNIKRNILVSAEYVLPHQLCIDGALICPFIVYCTEIQRRSDSIKDHVFPFVVNHVFVFGICVANK